MGISKTYGSFGRITLRTLRGLTLGICIALSVGFLSAKEESIDTKVLLRNSTSWDWKPYVAYPSGAPELTVLQITIPPHTALPWHQHPMPVAAYVQSGEIIVEKKEGGKKRKFSQGQVIAEMVNETHRGTTGNTPAVLIVFYAGSLGQHLSRIVAP
jgi:quercetin dioxygenase-like cupin family protein